MKEEVVIYLGMNNILTCVWLALKNSFGGKMLFYMPTWLLNASSVNAFDRLFVSRVSRKSTEIVLHCSI